jgi:hypothetical protein
VTVTELLVTAWDGHVLILMVLALLLMISRSESNPGLVVEVQNGSYVLGGAGI